MAIPGLTPEEEASLQGLAGFQMPNIMGNVGNFNFSGMPKFESLPQITEQAVVTPPPFVYTDSMGRRVLSREEKVENVYRQITGQVKNLDTSKYWRGGGIGAFGGIDGAARWIAGQLVDYGISSIDQIGQKEEPVLAPNYSADPYNANVLYNSFLNEWSQSGRPLPELGETVTFNNKRYVIDRVNFSGEPDVGLIPYEPTGQTEKIVINKNTGQPLVTPGHQHQYAANWVYPDGSAIFSGTYAGGGNTMFKMQFDSQGLPIFYSDGASSSDFELKDLAPFVAIASLAIPGMGVAIGNFVAGAAGLTVSAPVAAAIGAGVLNTVLTGDIKTGVLSAVGSYVGANIGKELGQAASGIFESSAGQNFIANIGAAGARAAVMGESVQDALSTAAVGGLFNLAASQVPGFDEIKDPKIKSAVADSINAALNTQGDLSAKLSNAALQGAITYGANKVEVDGKKFPELTPGQKSLIVTTLSSQLTGKPLNQELINAAISNTNNELTAAIRQPTPLAPVGADEFTGGTPAAQPEDFGQVTGGLPTAPAEVIQPTYSSFMGPAQVSPAGDVGPAIIRDNLSFPTDPEAMGYQGFPRPIYELPVTVPQGQFPPPVTEFIPPEASPITVRRELVPNELVNQEQTREQISDQVFDQLTQLFEDRDPTTLKLAAELAVNNPWDFDPNIPTPLGTEQDLTQYGKGLVSAVENITKGAPILLSLQADAWNVEKAQTALQRFDLIDEGKLNEAVKPVQGSIYGMRLLSQYANASPERRLEMRQEQQANIENSVSGAREGIRLYEAFRKDMEQYKPNIPNFTDIRTENIGDLAKDFGDWLAFNVGAGGPSVAASILGALVAGPAGALAVGSTLGTSEA